MMIHAQKSNIYQTKKASKDEMNIEKQINCK